MQSYVTLGKGCWQMIEMLKPGNWTVRNASCDQGRCRHQQFSPGGAVKPAAMSTAPACMSKPDPLPGSTPDSCLKLWYLLLITAPSALVPYEGPAIPIVVISAHTLAPLPLIFSMMFNDSLPVGSVISVSVLPVAWPVPGSISFKGNPLPLHSP